MLQGMITQTNAAAEDSWVSRRSRRNRLIGKTVRATACAGTFVAGTYALSRLSGVGDYTVADARRAVAVGLIVWGLLQLPKVRRSSS